MRLVSGIAHTVLIDKHLVVRCKGSLDEGKGSGR